jgi:hypothetical protein
LASLWGYACFAEFKGAHALYFRCMPQGMAQDMPRHAARFGRSD